MPNLTIKNLPREVHRRLKTLAKENRRSLNSEVIDILARSLPPAPIDVEAILSRIDALNRKYPGFTMTPEEIKAAKEVGRM